MGAAGMHTPALALEQQAAGVCCLDGVEALWTGWKRAHTNMFEVWGLEVCESCCKQISRRP